VCGCLSENSGGQGWQQGKGSHGEARGTGAPKGLQQGVPRGALRRWRLKCKGGRGVGCLGGRFAKRFASGRARSVESTSGRPGS